MDFADIKQMIRNNKIADVLRPKEYLSSVYNVDLDGLISSGIKALIVDLDDTLIPRSEYRVPLATYGWVAKIKDKGLKIYLASNGGRLPRVNFIIKELNIDGSALAFKPLPFAFTHALKTFKIKANETAVIGDQLITDILGGNMLGMYTILIKPITEERSIIRLPMRAFEDLLIRALGLTINS